MLIAGGLVYDRDGDTDRPAQADILIDGNRIAAVGPGLRALHPNAPVVDARDHLVLPGFINAHYHSHDTLLKDFFEALPVELWSVFALPPSFPRRSRHELRARTLIGAVECLHGGITTVQDMDRVLVVLGHTFDGFDINMMGLVLPGIGAEFHAPPLALGYLASSVFTGMLVGSIAIGMLADRVGRKGALIFAVGFYGLTSLAAAFAWSYDSLVAIRIVEGFGLGAEVPLVFTYLSEFMPRRHRGILLASSVFIWQGALFIAALAATVVVPAYGWRGMFVVDVIPSAILVVLFL